MPASRATGALVDAHLDDLSKAARAVFGELMDGSDPADALGFALFSDVDGADVTAAVNTRQTLAENIERYSDPEYSEGLEPEFSWERYLRFAPGEWTLTSADLDTAATRRLREVWDTIKAIREQVSTKEAVYWPSIQYETGYISLGYLIEDGWCDGYPEAVRVFTVMDDDDDLDDMARWLGMLNDQRWDEVEAYLTNEY